MPAVASKLEASRIKRVTDLVVISDTHCGCKMGLMAPSGAKHDEQNAVTPNRMQMVMWRWWEEFWEVWVPRVTEGRPYVVVHNGDCVDGIHHRSTTQWSSESKDHCDAFIDIMRPRLSMAAGYFHIRGTEAHVGQSAVDEERCAVALNAIPKDGRHSRYELWKTCGDHLVHFLHHVGSTSSSAHESSAVNAELAAEFNEAARWSEKAPSVIVRSHRHRAIEIRRPGPRGYYTAAVTACWQLKTPFAWKIPGARLSPPQIGGMLVRLDNTGAIYTQQFVKHLKRDEPE